MAAMGRGLVHVLAWSCATGAAVTLSWWGVHTVMTGTAYDPPRALPVTAAIAPATSSPAPTTPSPSVTSPSPSATPSSPRPSADRGASPQPSASRRESTAPSPSPTTSGQVKSYATDGGRVVFDLAATSATLVSATPGSGWAMQVWKTDTWIRVEFTSGENKVSVICAWHDGPPHVDVGAY